MNERLRIEYWLRLVFDSDLVILLPGARFFEESLDDRIVAPRFDQIDHVTTTGYYRKARTRDVVSQSPRDDLKEGHLGLTDDDKRWHAYLSDFFHCYRSNWSRWLHGIQKASATVVIEQRP